MAFERSERSSGREPGVIVPAYYWAGNGSMVIHRLKGFGRPVDGEAYLRAYEPERLRWLRDRAGVTCVFLSYNWGLPPELEAEDWRAFERAARTCHDLGMQAAAYIQPSNAAASGSFALKAWYAVTPKGKRIPYYNGRFFTCLNDPEWREWVFERCMDACRRGADVLFFDNCAFGGMPIPLSRDYTAFAGCACGRCRERFAAWQERQGLAPLELPRLFRPARDEAARRFARWRAETLTRFLRGIVEEVRLAYPGTKFVTNTVGGVNVNTFNVFGADLPAIASFMDWLFVENLQSPRCDGSRLVQNAGTYGLLRALRPGAPALSIAYERGIGVDGPPAAAVFARVAAEGFAAGGTPVLRAAEYIRDGKWSLLQPGTDDRRLEAFGRVVAAYAALLRGGERREAARVGVYVPDAVGWGGDLYPGSGDDYLAVIQALVGAGIPFRVIGERNEPCDLGCLLVPASADPPAWFGGRVMRFGELGLRMPRARPFRWFGGPLEPVVRVLGPRVVDGYYSRVHVRRFVDRLDLLFRLVFGGRFERVPMREDAARLLAAMNPVQVELSGPGYVHLWESERGLEVHLVNYGDAPLRAEVRGGRGSRPRVEGDGREAPGGRVEVGVFAVAVLERAAERERLAAAAR
ncbi:hypothetical protein [Tepidiforma sp.]|uniref:hypothetical protein n=1 Tax=Tepidiforma sp. TaxID=2682230 RepID=UPI00261DEB2C|nr:hypothetical protein [Tepidiforma sp.]MCX7616521.1 hypothetical protein [Tepidiforma sp.]